MRHLWLWSIIGLASWKLVNAAEYAAVLNIHGLGHDRLGQLQDDARVQWHIEAGNELLIATTHATVIDVIAHDYGAPKIRTLGKLARDEVFFREHACLEERKLAAHGVLGGFELMRAPASLVRSSLAYSDKLIPAPINGALSIAIANQKPSDRSAKDQRSAVVQSIVNQVSADRWRSNVQALSGFNRNTFNEDINNAHDWIFGRFQSLGLNTQSFSFDISAETCEGTPAITRKNPIGIKLGTLLPNEWIVIGAHYDSRNVNGCESTGVQPGANDNASGCAAVIELAQVFQNQPTARTLVFTCFAGEEQGLLGSKQYVQALQSSPSMDIQKVKLMINLDMIGHDPNNIQEARIETLFSAQFLYPIFASAAARYAPELSLIQTSTTFAYSDHWYFLQANVPAIFTWENGAGIYPQYHTSADLLPNMTNANSLARGIMRMDAAVIAEQAIEVRLFSNGFENTGN
jgi:hypothetical protein